MHILIAPLMKILLGGATLRFFSAAPIRDSYAIAYNTRISLVSAGRRELAPSCEIGQHLLRRGGVACLMIAEKPDRFGKHKVSPYSSCGALRMRGLFVPRERVAYAGKYA